MIRSSTQTPVEEAVEHTTNMTRKGQVTVPAHFRRQLRLTEHDRFTVTLSGAEIRLRRVGSVAQSTFGAVPRVGEPAQLDRTRKEFEEAAGREVKAE